MEQCLQLKNGLKLFVESTEQPSIVPWLLGSFASLKGNQNVLEFCAGNGAASFWCVDNGFRGNILLLDQRANALQLAEKTIDQNHLSAIKTICSSVETFRSSEKFDCILCNPPFFSESFISKDDDLRAIRHEGGLTLDELCMSSAMSLKQKGHFYLCHTPSRLSEIILSLDKNKFEIKGLRFCRHNSDAFPFLVLIDAVYQGGKGIKVYPDLIVIDEEGKYTNEMNALFERNYL